MKSLPRTRTEILGILVDTWTSRASLLAPRYRSSIARKRRKQAACARGPSTHPPTKASVEPFFYEFDVPAEEFVTRDAAAGTVALPKEIVEIVNELAADAIVEQTPSGTRLRCSPDNIAGP